MRRLLMIMAMLVCMVLPVSAENVYAPEAPQSVQQYLPDNTENFGQGLWYVFRSAVDTLQPSLVDACTACFRVVAIAILVGILTGLSEERRQLTELIGVTAVSVLLYQPANSLIRLGTDTVYQISQYGKLLLPVMAGALTAQGAVTKSAILYTATAFVDALLSAVVTDLLVPLLYIFLSTAIASSAFNQEILNNIRNFIILQF